MSTRYFSDRIVAYKENDAHIAVSLNFDLIAEGDNFREALSRLEDAIVGYLTICCEDKEPDEKIYRPAPREYQQKFDLFSGLTNKMSSKKRGALERGQRAFLKQEPQTILRTFSTNMFAHA